MVTLRDCSAAKKVTSFTCVVLFGIFLWDLFHESPSQLQCEISLRWHRLRMAAPVQGASKEFHDFFASKCSLMRTKRGRLASLHFDRGWTVVNGEWWIQNKNCIANIGPTWSNIAQDPQFAIWVTSLDQRSCCCNFFGGISRLCLSSSTQIIYIIYTSLQHCNKHEKTITNLFHPFSVSFVFVHFVLHLGSNSTCCSCCGLWVSLSKAMFHQVPSPPLAKKKNLKSNKIHSSTSWNETIRYTKYNETIWDAIK